MTLELKDIIKFYVSGREITKALKDINLSMETGEFIAITGESGSGKSTLAHIMAGVLPADKGTIWLKGESTSHYGEEEWESYRRDPILHPSPHRLRPSPRHRPRYRPALHRRG